MIVRFDAFGITMDISKRQGELAVYLDSDEFETVPVEHSVKYLNNNAKIERINPENEQDDGYLVFILSPPCMSDGCHTACHRYLITTYPSSDTYLPHQQYHNLTLTEHDSGCWELNISDTNMRIIMPIDFKVCEMVSNA